MPRSAASIEINAKMGKEKRSFKNETIKRNRGKSFQGGSVSVKIANRKKDEGHKKTGG